ncbi:hypothetical protein [Bartonella sp. MM73XJBT.G]|uniref:hypothetical protein n=1 Tax=Bartonella sp. MM73XJBT.G TaxID=3019097 RepID=UPI002363044E|nr:hypothetical protein [Bartonella sp. MM73XJBT.G]
MFIDFCLQTFVYRLLFTEVVREWEVLSCGGNLLFEGGLFGAGLEFRWWILSENIKA